MLQKKAHLLNEVAKEGGGKPATEAMGLLITPTWLLGLLIMVIMPLPIDFVANAYASQSLLAPTAALTIASNQVLAPMFLDEKLGRGEIAATFIIIFGVLISTLSGSHAEQTYTVCTLMDLYKKSTFYVPVTVLSIALCAAFKVRDDRELLGKYRPATIAFLAGGLGALNNLFFKATGELAFSDDSSHWGTIHPYVRCEKRRAARPALLAPRCLPRAACPALLAPRSPLFTPP